MGGIESILKYICATWYILKLAGKAKALQKGWGWDTCQAVCSCSAPVATNASLVHDGHVHFALDRLACLALSLISAVTGLA